MKAEHVKTPQNTEEVSSHPGKKGIGAKKAIGIPPVSEKNRGRTGKKACKFGRREDNHETGKNQFIYAMNIKSNGKSRLDVLDAPEFPAIAPELLARLTRADLVIAHKADFDIEHLRETLDHFGLPRPEFDYICTCQLARRVWPELENHQLSTLTAHIGHDFNHHHAQADAEAAGRVLLAMMQHAKAPTPRELLQKAGMKPARFDR
jgi:DNA polymerase III epsilon subunit-like protein